MESEERKEKNIYDRVGELQADDLLFELCGRSGAVPFACANYIYVYIINRKDTKNLWLNVYIYLK